MSNKGKILESLRAWWERTIQGTPVSGSPADVLNSIEGKIDQDVKRIAVVVVDKTAITTDEQAYIDLLEARYEVVVFDEADVDTGVAIWTNFAGIMVFGVTTTEIDEFVDMEVPILTVNDDVAVKLKLGTATLIVASRDYINITDNSHEISTEYPTGTLTIYTSAGAQKALNPPNLASGSVQIAGGLIVAAEFGAVATTGFFSERRLLFGLPEGSNLNGTGQELFYSAIAFLVGNVYKPEAVPYTLDLDTSNDNPGAGQDRYEFIAPVDGILHWDLSLLNIVLNDDFTFTVEKYIGVQYVQIANPDIDYVPDDKRISGTGERMYKGDRYRWTITRNSGTNRTFSLDIMLERLPYGG